MSLRERRHGGGVEDALKISYTGNGTATFDPSFTTNKSTTMLLIANDNTVIQTAPGTSHAFSYIPATGPHTCKVMCAAGLGAITAIDANTDALTSIKKLNKCLLNSVSNGCFLYSNADLVMRIGDLPQSIVYLYLNSDAKITGSLSQLPPLITYLFLKGLPLITGSLDQLPVTIQSSQLYWSDLITAGSISYLVSLASLDIRSMGIGAAGWNQASVDLVLKSVSNGLHTDINHFTAAAITLNIGGANQPPSHLDGYIDPLIAPGTGNTDAHWEWDAGTSTHKAIAGGSAIWEMTHKSPAHLWTVTYNGGLAIAKVLGTALTTWDTVYPADTIYFSEYTAVAGTAAEIRLTAALSGNVKVAIYNAAGNTLLASGVGAVVAGANVISLNAQVPTTALGYWLAIKSDTANLIKGQAITAIPSALLADTYANAMPANPAVSWTTGGTINLALAAWGLTV
jgi:hypothetical protein